jgi:hypothetical protein
MCICMYINFALTKHNINRAYFFAKILTIFIDVTNAKGVLWSDSLIINIHLYISQYMPTTTLFGLRCFLIFVTYFTNYFETPLLKKLNFCYALKNI